MTPEELKKILGPGPWEINGPGLDECTVEIIHDDGTQYEDFICDAHVKSAPAIIALHNIAPLLKELWLGCELKDDFLIKATLKQLREFKQ